MIIKLIPETDMEKARLQEVEHSGVGEFFIFGNKRDNDGTLLDFHDWNGSYRYLIGSIYYFTQLLSDEQQIKMGQERGPEISLQPQQPPLMLKNNEGKIEQVVKAEDLQKEIDQQKEAAEKESKKGETIQFPSNAEPIAEEKEEEKSEEAADDKKE